MREGNIRRKGTELQKIPSILWVVVQFIFFIYLLAATHTLQKLVFNLLLCSEQHNDLHWILA